jgi:uncharacterized membrane protein
MTVPTISPTPPSRRSWGRIALIAVLLLSLVGNALAVGALIRFREVRAELLGDQSEFTRLPPEVRQELGDALRTNARSLRPLLRDVLRARIAMTEAAMARPYNRAATEAAMEDFRRDLDLLLVEVQIVFLDRLGEIAKQ